MTNVNNTEDILDSRDVIARIEELENEREALKEEPAQMEAWDASPEADELKTLQALAEEAAASPDWEYGEALIRNTYFREYAEELAEDSGMVVREVSNRWPYTCIDWDRAADELRQDYISVDFGGIEYLIRA